MKTNRRQFLSGTAATVAGLSLPSANLLAESKSDKPLNILVLGGTGFIGPHIVRKFLSRGHKVTLFNRGKRNTHLFPDLETIVGDRDPKKGKGLSGLEGRKFDVVVDNSGYVPRHVEGSAKLLSDLAPHYLFISTVAVYDQTITGEITEDSPLLELSEPGSEDVGKHYGALKVLCEAAVAKHYPKNHTILRPTYIIGPGDHTDRFIHYIDRPLHGGRMAMPAPKSNSLRFVDVRDLADYVLNSIENKLTGIYNMVNDPGSVNWGQYLDLSVSLSKSDVQIEWMDFEFLKTQEGFEHPVYTAFPMWLHPTNVPPISQARSLENGFSNMPFRETVIDTFNWWMQQSEERRTTKKRKTFPKEREMALLKAWDAYKAKS